MLCTGCKNWSAEPLPRCPHCSARLPKRLPAQEYLFRLALDRAPENSILLLDAGEIKLTAPLVLNKNMHIRGLGPLSTRISCEEADFVLTCHTEQLRLHDLAIYHVGTVGADVLILGANCWLEAHRCHIQGGYSNHEGLLGSGVVLRHGARARLLECQINENSEYGVLLCENSHILLDSCQIQRNMQHGVVFSNQSTGTVRHCMLSDNQIGVVLEHQANPVLEFNRMHYNRDYGVYCHSGAGQLQDNQLLGNSLADICVTHDSTAIFEGNLGSVLLQ